MTGDARFKSILLIVRKGEWHDCTINQKKNQETEDAEGNHKQVCRSVELPQRSFGSHGL